MTNNNQSAVWLAAMNLNCFDFSLKRCILPVVTHLKLIISAYLLFKVSIKAPILRFDWSAASTETPLMSNLAVGQFDGI